MEWQALYGQWYIHRSVCSTLHLKFVDARVSGGTHQQESNLETECGNTIATYGI